jgi:hypothetical protein
MAEQPSFYKFSLNQIETVNNSVAMAEELVSNYYKMSASEWLHPKYDVKTLADLSPDEITQGPFAQVIRYIGYRKDRSLGSEAYDFYKICLQDHAIHSALQSAKELALFPFCLYIVVHELIHIVRFSKFLQSFDASPEEKLQEETRVHELTHHILSGIRVAGLIAVFDFYSQWREPIEGRKNS